MDGYGSWVAALVFAALNAAAASSGVLFRPGEWYERLDKPWWTPPNWLFGPAWSVLYMMSALAAWLVWLRGDTAALVVPLGLYMVQLALNAAWSGLFFGLRRPDLAFAELIVMWIAILATIVAFAAVRTDAALLMLPYLAWVTFAGALNFAVWRRNMPAAQRRATSGGG